MSKYTIKKIDTGHYEYRGYDIKCLGYYPPERSIVWEAYDEFDCGFAHAHALREVRLLIDSELDK